MTYYYNGLVGVRKYVDIRWEKHKKKWDTVGVIVGDEGISKSTLAEWILDYWMTKKNGECKLEDVKHMSLTGKDFVNDLSDCEKNDIPIFDEAGELDSRRAMSKFNVLLTQAYKVIRADTLFTILVLPELWDLEPRFRNRRIKFLMVITRRGRVAFWLKDKVRKICAINQDRKVKNYFVVQPDFCDKFPIYDGVMAEAYNKLKDKKTTEARRELKNLINGSISTRKITTTSDVPKTVRLSLQAKTLYDKGFNHRQIGEHLDVSRRYVGDLLKSWKSEEET